MPAQRKLEDRNFATRKATPLWKGDDLMHMTASLNVSRSERLPFNSCSRSAWVWGVTRRTKTSEIRMKISTFKHDKV